MWARWIITPHLDILGTVETTGPLAAPPQEVGTLPISPGPVERVERWPLTITVKTAGTPPVLLGEAIALWEACLARGVSDTEDNLYQAEGNQTLQRNPYQPRVDRAESEEESVVRVPGGTPRFQPDLPRGGERRPGRRGDLVGGGVSWRGDLGGRSVSWRDCGSADRHRTQPPHRSEAHSLDPLARRHWVQLGLGRRRGGHQPILRAPVLQYPVQSALQHPLSPGVERHPTARQAGPMWFCLLSVSHN